MQEVGPESFNREEEPPQPWPPAALAEPPSLEAQGVYAAADFGVYDKRRKKADGVATLPFPDYVLLSRNHADREWAAKAPRRLRNVIVTMEWVPDAAALAARDEEAGALTAEQESALRDAFKLLDVDDSKALDRKEVQALIAAVDADADVSAVLARVDADGSGDLSFDELRAALATSAFYSIEAGRYYVALSLAEAESLRALLHATAGGALLPGSNATLALRCDRGGVPTLLDASDAFAPAAAAQARNAAAALRFVDSHADFEKASLNALLRSLQPRPCEERAAWWLKVRSCRRRPRREWQQSTIAQVFSVASQFDELKRTALIARTRALIRKKRLYIDDAFRVFDADQSGYLSCSELFSAFQWLGLPQRPNEIYELARAMDTDNDGFVTIGEWKAWFATGAIGDGAGAGEDADQYADEEISGAADPGAIAIEQTRIRELHETRDPKAPKEAEKAADAPLEPAELAKLTARLVKPKGYAAVWASRGTNTGRKGSVWAPSLSKDLASANRVRVALGHVATAGFSPPKANAPLVLELHDTACWSGMQSSDALRRAVPQLLPHPVNYRQVWACMKGKTPLVVWRPLPPEGFVALGMLVTADETPPPVESIHCVPAGWTAPVRGVPAASLVWDDAGLGGKPGALWSVADGGLGLMACAAGHGAPDELRTLNLAPGKELPFAELEAKPAPPTPEVASEDDDDGEDREAEWATKNREERSKKTMERVRKSKSKAPALGDVGADHKISFTKRASSTQI